MRYIAADDIERGDACFIGNDSRLYKFTDTRRIDTAIAEKVMGWQWFDIPHNSEQKVLAPSAMQAKTLRLGAHILSLVPRYSDDMADAWQVVIVMEHKHRWSFMLDRRDGDQQAVAFYRTDGHHELLHSLPRDIVEVRANNTAKAICLAALKALEIEVP